MDVKIFYFLRKRDWVGNVFSLLSETDITK